MSEELKPCPFCGKSDLDSVYSDENSAAYWIECITCGFVLIEGDKIQADKAWNKRA